MSLCVETKRFEIDVNRCAVCIFLVQSTPVWSPQSVSATAMGARSVSLGDLNGYVETSRLRSARDVGLTNVRALCKGAVHCEVLSHATFLCSDGAVDIVAVGYSDNQVALYVLCTTFSMFRCIGPSRYLLKPTIPLACPRLIHRAAM